MRSSRTALTAFVLTASAVLGLTVQAEARPPKQKKVVKRRDAARVEDLFWTGYEHCRAGRYGLALWPLEQAVKKSKRPPGIRLWLAHARVQTGHRRQGIDTLRAIERGPAAAKPNARAGTSLYLACARNCLGVLEALRGKSSKSRAKARDLFAKASQGWENARGAEAVIRRIAEQNYRLLDTGKPLTWWVETSDIPNESRRDAGKHGDRRSPAGRLTVPPIAVRLLTAGGALEQARRVLEQGQGSKAPGRLGEALRVADDAKRLEPRNPDAYLVLADLYEAKKWFIEALDELESLRRLRGRKGARERRRVADNREHLFRQTHPELDLEPEWLGPSSEHFRLRLQDRRTVRAARDALGHLETTRQDALRDFGVALPVVYVRLFADREVLLKYAARRQRRPAPQWAGAFAVPNPHSPAIMAYAGVPASALRHEYAHLVLRALAGRGDLPGWLNEGFACVVERGRTTDREYAALGRPFRALGLPRPEELEVFWGNARFQSEAGPQQAELYYETARCVVSFFLDTYGTDGMLEWLLLIHRGESGRRSFERVTGCTWEQFFRTWANECLP